MNRKLSFIVTLVSLTFIGSSVHANCQSFGSSRGLENYCFLNFINNRIIDPETARHIDVRLKSEGYASGLGLGLDNPATIKSANLSVSPLFYYSSNINGGNPSKPLKLGNLTFAGDENLYRKSGLLAGAGIGLNGRYLYGVGKYLDYSINGGYAYSPKQQIGIGTSGANICSKNHIKNWWYFDSCASTNRARKEITEEKNSTISLKISKLFSDSKQTHHQLSTGLSRYFADAYTQNQLSFTLDTIHKKGMFTGFDFVIGDGIKNQLAVRRSLTAKVGAFTAGKSLTFVATYSEAEGGVLLGFERGDKTILVSASYPIWRNVTASIGYRKADSTINYFDIDEPTLGIQFSPIQF